MNISLQPEQEQFIQAKLKTGKYENAEQIIVEAFKLLEQRDQHYETWLQETREKLKVGIEQLERGEGIDGETVINKLREKFINNPEISNE